MAKQEPGVYRPWPKPKTTYQERKERRHRNRDGSCNHISLYENMARAYERGDLKGERWERSGIYYGPDHCSNCTPRGETLFRLYISGKDLHGFRRAKNKREFLATSSHKLTRKAASCVSETPERPPRLMPDSKEPPPKDRAKFSRG